MVLAHALRRIGMRPLADEIMHHSSAILTNHITILDSIALVRGKIDPPQINEHVKVLTEALRTAPDPNQRF